MSIYLYHTLHDIAYLVINNLNLLWQLGKAKFIYFECKISIIVATTSLTNIFDNSLSQNFKFKR